MPTLLAATWSDGLFVLAGEKKSHELAGHSVRALASDEAGGAFAIVDGHALRRRTHDGAWSTIATSELDLAALTVVGDAVYLGTDDARVLRVRRDGAIEPLPAFDRVAGRDTWYAGSAVVDGRVVGPPLGVRSMTATSDGSALLVNVHVGGIPRSTDGGATWRPTIEVDSDVHEVRAHPVRPEIVIAAAASGLGISRDGGRTWSVEQDGLHASYCSAVAFSGDDVLVAASTGHFDERGAVYRRSIGGSGPLRPIDGLPRWLGGIVDTGGIAALGAALAVVDKEGNLHTSTDAGRLWVRGDDAFPPVSKLLWI